MCTLQKLANTACAHLACMLSLHAPVPMTPSCILPITTHVFSGSPWLWCKPLHTTPQPQTLGPVHAALGRPFSPGAFQHLRRLGRRALCSSVCTVRGCTEGIWPGAALSAGPCHAYTWHVCAKQAAAEGSPLLAGAVPVDMEVSLA